MTRINNEVHLFLFVLCCFPVLLTVVCCSPVLCCVYSRFIVSVLCCFLIVLVLPYMYMYIGVYVASSPPVPFAPAFRSQERCAPFRAGPLFDERVLFDVTGGRSPQWVVRGKRCDTFGSCGAAPHVAILAPAQHGRPRAHGAGRRKI